MWMSEIVAQKLQRQMAEPVRHGHLQVHEGGKIDESFYVRPNRLWQRIRSWLAQRRRSVRLCDMPPQ